MGRETKALNVYKTILPRHWKVIHVYTHTVYINLRLRLDSLAQSPVVSHDSGPSQSA